MLLQSFCLPLCHSVMSPPTDFIAQHYLVQTAASSVPRGKWSNMGPLKQLVSEQQQQQPPPHVSPQSASSAGPPGQGWDPHQPTSRCQSTADAGRLRQGQAAQGAHPAASHHRAETGQKRDSAVPLQNRNSPPGHTSAGVVDHTSGITSPVQAEVGVYRACTGMGAHYTLLGSDEVLVKLPAVQIFRQLRLLGR